MWQTIIIAILHVIKRDIIERHCGLNVWRWNLLNFNFLERHWVYLKDTDLTEVKETALEVKNLSFLHWWKKRNISIVKTIQKYKIKGMCSRELFRRSIHIQTCFVLWTQRHWRKKPLCLRSDGGGVVLSVCDCRALADSRSCFALVAVRLGGFIRDCLHLRRGFVYLRLRHFTFVIYNDFTTGGKRKEKFISSVSQSSVLSASALYIISKDRLTQKWLFCYDLFTLMFWQTWVSFYLSFFLSFFSETQKMDFDETEEYARYSF